MEIAEKVILIHPFRPPHKKLPYTALFPTLNHLLRKRPLPMMVICQDQFKIMTNLQFFLPPALTEEVIFLEVVKQ